MRSFFTLLFSLLCFSSMAWKNPGNGNGKGTQTPQLAAGCTPPKNFTDMNFNNVKARIYTGGDMWWDLVGAPMYEVPAGSGKHALFAGGLWIGGQDINGQLKLAAKHFGPGVDYWTGPLSINSADIDAPTCAEWDKHFIITRQEVDEFIAWFNSQDPDPTYEIPESILEWPAHGNTAAGQAYYLAPFHDTDGDGVYNPYNGDYPNYDVKGEVDCSTDRSARLYGDYTLWWIFNDKGNVHTESDGSPIGMEIHAQAFAFATNDEINNMTFYNYRLINRSTFTLQNTYFGVWTDADLGFFDDDYVGCDVARGLGYSYNGYDTDGTGAPTHYGVQPPAVGVDFFEGPYQDNDGVDNAVGIGPNEALNGLGYGDTIVDNERFGMRRFLYFNKPGTGTPPTTDPEDAADYYNFLRSIWKDQTPMFYGGTGHHSDPNANQNFPTAFMFPGNSDPLNWGTGGVDPGFSWTEETSNNVPFDRRFVQSAGPFTLLPGAVNDITVGVVWARATSGGPWASVEKLRQVDDKAQSLFENCFRILDGPVNPDVSIKELDRELVLLLHATPQHEAYEQVDPFIPQQTVTTTVNYVETSAGSGNYQQVITTDTIPLDRTYNFQGYQIFQVVSADVSPSELYDADRARLVYQVDVEDSVSRLINFDFDESLGASVPREMTPGDNKGVRHSFRILEDKFATGDKRLVNHKQYHFMVISYAHNEFKKYDPNDPLLLDGQKKPYLSGRKSAVGKIRVYSGIPHINMPEAGGTIINSIYGEGPFVTRKEGQGNGGQILDFTMDTEQEIMKGAPWKSEFPMYKKGRGPVDIKVIDPLAVPNAEFRLTFEQEMPMRQAGWLLENLTTGESVKSDTTLQVKNEQLIPQWGLSVTATQVIAPGDTLDKSNGFLEATLEFENQGSRWLTGIADRDGLPQYDWIRAGLTASDIADKDNNEIYENSGVPFFAPYGLSQHSGYFPGFSAVATALSKMDSLKSIDIVFTADKSLWTRCPVIETGTALTENDAKKGYLRLSNSVDKNGENDLSGQGMGWFPGYAICLETGERLNMAFGENSFLAGENGRDMLWNPTSTEIDQSFAPRFGGMHYIYVFNHSGSGPDDQPSYDEGKWMYAKFQSGTNTDLRNIWKTAMWTGIPMLAPNQKLLSATARIRLRVKRPYARYATAETLYNGWPHYQFNTSDMAASKGSAFALKSALSLINVVPNPYYAFSEYEDNQLENKIKVTNLPEECTISIYTMSGTLVRRFRKASPITSQEWDLENHVGIPVASGIYLIHIDVPGVGEKVLKWYGIRRPVDLQSF